MDAEQKRRQAKEFLKTVDWSSYDFKTAPGADMSFPDFDEDDETDRPIWFPNHYNKTSGMSCRHVPDLNKINKGKMRRLWALYGMPVEWDFEDKPTIAARIQEIDAARAQGGEAFATTLGNYGMLNDEHYQWMRRKASGRRAEALAEGREEAQKLINQKTEQLKQEHQARVEGELKGELQPVEGVSMEQWATLMAQIASGADAGTVASGAGLDSAKWERVSNEWNARMARDTTATIATVYGQAFSGAGQGQFGAAGQATAAAMNPGGSVEGSAEPIPFEKWIEVTVAQDAAASQGGDAAQVLAGFGMSPADWGVAGGWWGQKFAANAYDMMDEYDKLTAKYRAKYGLADTEETSDELEERVTKDVAEMAKGGRGAEMMPYLKKTFPDDADDNDALDHYLGLAADQVASKGDKRAAMVILGVRYEISDDQDDPKDEWIASEMEMLFDD